MDVGVDDRSTRYIICHRPEQADRDLTQHTDVMAGLHTEFEADREGAQKPPNPYPHRETQGADWAHQLKRALRDHPKS